MIKFWCFWNLEGLDYVYDDYRDDLCLIFICYLEFFVYLGYFVLFFNMFLVEMGYGCIIILDLLFLYDN